MWTLTPDNLAQARSELQRRRAAIEARYAAELKTIDADLEEIETLERVAQSFSAKHRPGSNLVLSEPGEDTPEPAAIAPEGNLAESEFEPEKPASKPALEATEPNDNSIAQLQQSTEEPTISRETPPKNGSSRWRIRIPSDTAPA